MASKIDLYTILKGYADKTNSPYIKINAFISFLETYASHYVKEYPDLVHWTANTAANFWAHISPLVESGKCELLSDTKEEQLYLCQYYVELIQQAYLSPDKNVEMPFPCEESLKINFGDNEIKYLSVEHDLAPYLEENGNEIDDPHMIIRLIFPDNFGSALILSSMIPYRLLETALLKIRNYLRNEGNRDYALHKLTVQLQGRENYLHEMLDQLIIRPLDCLAKLADGGENSAFFWVCFCSLVRNDIKKKNDFLSEDLAVLQAVFVVDACNNFYQLRAIKKRERELALKNLELQLENPPFLYSLEEITKFSNNKGIPLMGQYSPEDLDQYIKTKTALAADQKLPELLIVSGKNYERRFVRKNKLIVLCMRLLNEARPQIKKAVETRWAKLLREYRKEAAMTNDEQFEKLLEISIEKITPALASVLKSKWLYLVYEEVSHNQEILSESSRLYLNGSLVPYASLLMLNRKNILTDIRILLPFWYSIPLFVALISFFRNLRRNSPVIKSPENSLSVIADEEPEEPAVPQGQARDTIREIRQAAKEMENDLVPPGHTRDTYLRELEDGWGRLLNKQKRGEMVEDVNALIRDRLRQNMRMKRHIRINRESLNALAEGIISSSPSLQSLSGQESLRLYIMLYLVKQLASESLSKFV
jgi:hypothetical protein